MAQVEVTLKNPPSGAELWQLALCDWSITVPIYQIGGLAHVGVAEPITFEIPSGVTFPLRVLTLQVSKWNADKTALIVLYEMQSYMPYLWDFDKMEWSTTPNPTYRGVFIPSLGSYYFNVATEKFEEIAITLLADIVGISAPSTATPGQKVTITVMVKNTGSSNYSISVTGYYDGVDVSFSPDSAIVGPGATYSFTCSFTMPNKDIMFQVWSWHWTGTLWYPDDTEYFNIALAAVVPTPEFSGFAISDYSKV